MPAVAAPQACGLPRPTRQTREPPAGSQSCGRARGWVLRPTCGTGTRPALPAPSARPRDRPCPVDGATGLGPPHSESSPGPVWEPAPVCRRRKAASNSGAPASLGVEGGKPPCTTCSGLALGCPAFSPPPPKTSPRQARASVSAGGSPSTGRTPTLTAACTWLLSPSCVGGWRRLRAGDRWPQASPRRVPLSTDPSLLSLPPPPLPHVPMGHSGHSCRVVRRALQPASRESLPELPLPSALVSGCCRAGSPPEPPPLRRWCGPAPGAASTDRPPVRAPSPAAPPTPAGARRPLSQAEGPLLLRAGEAQEAVAAAHSPGRVLGPERRVHRKHLQNVLHFLRIFFQESLMVLILCFNYKEL